MCDVTFFRHSPSLECRYTIQFDACWLIAPFGCETKPRRENLKFGEDHGEPRSPPCLLSSYGTMIGFSADGFCLSSFAIFTKLFRSGRCFNTSSGRGSTIQEKTDNLLHPAISARGMLGTPASAHHATKVVRKSWKWESGIPALRADSRTSADVPWSRHRPRGVVKRIPEHEFKLRRRSRIILAVFNKGIRRPSKTERSGTVNCPLSQSTCSHFKLASSWNLSPV